MASQPTRRRVLVTLAGTGTMAVLAGCGGDGGGTGDGDGDGGGDGGGEDGDGGTDGDGGGDTETDSPTATPTPTSQAETVLVGPDTQNVFEPDSLEIPAGTSVTFVWESSGHSLLVDSQPDGAEWEGISETQNEGFEQSHTFEVPGTYEYYCEPHQTFGMEASITVTE